MKLISCAIENFLSIEKAHVDFSDSGLLLIEGWNYDVDRANGAGKTAILNALSFAIYDKLPRKVTSTELLRRGSKKGFVSVTIDTGSNVYVVRRERPRGVHFYQKVDQSLEEISLTQEEWEAKIRLTYNQFIVSMYCSQANSMATPRFLLLNDSDKKQFLLQLLNLNEFTLCKKKCDEKINSWEIKFQELHRKMSELQVKIDAYSESLIDETDIKLMLSKKQDSKLALEKALQETQLILKPDLAKYQKLEEDILSKKTEFLKQKTRREMLMNNWNQLSRKIKPFNTTSSCPTCGSSLDTSHAEVMHNQEIERLAVERTSVKQQIDNIDVLLLGESKVDELHLKLKERKRKESAEYERSSIDRAELTARLNSVNLEIRNFDKSLNDNVQLMEKISKLQLQKNELKDQVEQVSKELEIQKTVASIYSPTGAQAYILDSAVNLFNEHIAKYVSILWSNLTYELQSYKENVKGEVTAKFSESIIMDGKPISLGSLSGGELKALSICTDMALLGILEQQFGIHMSPIIFDEAFDGLDSSGKEFALELIRGLANDRQVIVIDHASEMRASFDKILRVEKRNGISELSIIT